MMLDCRLDRVTEAYEQHQQGPHTKESCCQARGKGWMIEFWDETLLVVAAIEDMMLAIQDADELLKLCVSVP